jgi:Asp-tRNA(Asn)/Glu-tRNA(Gln) amidotransferase A subunit family amidase
MTNTIERFRTPLAATSQSLRSDERDLDSYYSAVESRVDSVEDVLEAFVNPPDFARVEESVETVRQRWERAAVKPPLYGVCVGVKDIYSVDGFPTKAGSDLPPSAFEMPDSPFVTRLREAGAVVLGKTVTTEFASAPTGPTRNPHALSHTPGGSSSGSAAAVAAGLVPLALGTQTVGSVVRPAAFCGIVGFKPSQGRLSTDGIVPFSPSADQPGLFTQDVAGMNLAASVVCSNWTQRQEPADSLNIGVPAGEYVEQANETGQEHFEAHLETLRKAGFTVEEMPVFDDITTVNDHHETMIEAEVAMEHADWYTEYGERYHPDTAAMVERGWETDIEAVGQGRLSQRATRKKIGQTIADFDLDVLVAPAAPGPAPEGLEDSGDPVMNLPWTHAGVPALTVPATSTETGLPLGLQCITAYGEDETLVANALQLEAVFDEAN